MYDESDLEQHPRDLVECGSCRAIVDRGSAAESPLSADDDEWTAIVCADCGWTDLAFVESD
jgi:RNase P subunit RPR2